MGVFFLAALLVRAASAEPSPPEVPRRNLSQFVELAIRDGAQLSEERGKVEYAQARERYAASQGLPSGFVDTLLIPIPGATGDAIVGHTEWDNWSALSQTKLQVVQPIYTFGALTNGRRAARAGVEAEQGLLGREEWLLRVQVAELYYGYQLAFELSELADDLADKLGQALNKAQKTSPRDADKLRVYLGEVQARTLEAHKGMDQARVGMAWKTGRYGREIPRWDQANLKLREFSLHDLPVYSGICLANRPELKALKKDQEAHDALVKVQQGLTYPTVFVGGELSYAHASNRPEQTSPFAYDPYNGLSGGVALGLHWNLGLFERSSQISQARAELLEVQGKAKFYESGIFAEVEKNYLDVKQTQEAVKIRGDASNAARRVFHDYIGGYILGTSNDMKSLLDSIGQFALAEKSRLESIYDFNVAVSKLEQSVGKDL